jgi:biotin carboxyl carrier protein
MDGATVEVAVDRVGAHERRLELRGETHRTLTSLQGADLLVEVDGVPHRISRDDGGLVRNLAPAIVVSIPVAPGDEVEAGDVVAVVESMKMETSLTAPFRGRVRQVLASPNVHVAAQAPLLRLEPLGDEPSTAATGDRVSFATMEGEPDLRAPRRCLENLRRLEWLMPGYDIGDEEVRRIIADLHGECADLSCDPALVPGEHRLLALFADLAALTRPRHDEADAEPELLRSPREHLHAWLRSLDAEAEGLPPTFVEQLRRALAGYGIESLDRTPALEDACYRLFLSQERAGAARAAVLAILDRRLQLAGELSGHVRDDFREALDRLVAVMDGRDAIVADLARDVRFRYFDEPLIEAARERVYDEVEGHLEALAGDPERADRGERLAALVASPRPLAPMLTHRMRGAPPPLRRVLLETVARRFYRVRTLEGFAEQTLDGHAFLTTRYRHDGPCRHLATAYVDLADLPAAARAFARWAATVPEGDLAVADFYAEYAGEPPAQEEIAERLRAALGEVPLPAAVHRIVVAVAEPGRGRGMSAMTPFTFRPGPAGLVEQDVLRGLHPMMSHRLRLSRLAEFGLVRLPSMEDVYLFHGVARSNPKDHRADARGDPVDGHAPGARDRGVGRRDAAGAGSAWRGPEVRSACCVCSRPQGGTSSLR